MHKVNHANGVPYDYLSNIVNGKKDARGIRLKAMLPRLKSRYAMFEAAYSSTNIGGVKQRKWTLEQNKDLLHCYESTARALEDLKSCIIQCQNEGTRDFCPYCGLGFPGQFDHYLPKEKFPEFSVHSHNLVPCCGICNGIKSSGWLDAQGARLFLNLYIDSLPTSPVLVPVAKWLTRNGMRVPVVTFSIKRPPYFHKAKFGLIETHFEKLDLLSRYQDQVHTEYANLRDAALAYGAKTVGRLSIFLTRYIHLREKTLGPLNWRIALYNVLIQDKPFLKSCLAP